MQLINKYAYVGAYFLNFNYFEQSKKLGDSPYREWIERKTCLKEQTQARTLAC